jgi:threonine/homoserine/homoserine lactone efflux protein
MRLGSVQWRRGRLWAGTAGYHLDVISWWGFVAVTVPLVLTPGSSTAVVLRNSLDGGTRAGLFTAVGANLGSLCYGILCAFGFAVALQRWPGVWLVLRVAGVLYLAWLGVQSLRHAASPGQRAAVEPGPASTARPPGSSSVFVNLREGFLTNATNPALATFYFVILPQFIPRDAPVSRSALALTLIHIGLAASWHSVWAAAGGTMSHFLSSGRPRQILNLSAGIAMLWLAVRLVV